MGKIIKNGISYGGSSSTAGNISYDNTSSGLAATTVQNAITELKNLQDNEVGKKEYVSNKLKGEIFNSYSGDNKNVASGAWSHAEGLKTTASGINSHAEGNQTVASGDYSHAEGSASEASGQYAHAEGDATKATYYYSHAEGYCSEATQYASHAEGSVAKASGYASHAEGSQTESKGQYSHAEGYSAKSSGNYSHAEGNGAIASGVGSHAGGQQTEAKTDYSTAIGRYNVVDGTGVSDPKHLFIVGNGTANDARSNVVEVSDTYLNVNGDIEQNGNKLIRQYSTMPDAEILYMKGIRVIQYIGSPDGTYSPMQYYINVRMGNNYSWTPYTPLQIHQDQNSLSNGYINVNGDIQSNGKSVVIQRSSLPTAAVTEEGNIYQYTGTTDANYINGYFYKCVSDGEETPTYSWEALTDDAPTNNSTNTVSSGGVHTALGNKQDIIQFTTMPAITPDMIGKVFQYVGTTDSNYVKGYFYTPFDTEVYTFQNGTTVKIIYTNYKGMQRASKNIPSGFSYWENSYTSTDFAPTDQSDGRCFAIVYINDNYALSYLAYTPWQEAQWDSQNHRFSFVAQNTNYQGLLNCPAAYGDPTRYAWKALVDSVPTENSTNLISSGSVYDALQDIEGGYEETVLYEINAQGSNTFSVPIATLRQYDIIGIDAGFYAAGTDPSVYTNRSNNWTYFPVSALPNTIAANAELLDMSAPIVYNEIVRFLFSADNSGNNFVVKEIRTHLHANEWPCAAFKAVGFKFKAVPKLGAEDTVLWETQDWKTESNTSLTLSQDYQDFDEIYAVCRDKSYGTIISGIVKTDNLPIYTSDSVDGSFYGWMICNESAYVECRPTSGTNWTITRHTADYFVNKIIGRKIQKVITNPRSYSETVLWANPNPTVSNPSTIKLSSAYTNFDEIIIVEKHIATDNTYTSTAKYLVSAMALNDMLGIALGDAGGLFTWYKLTAADELTEQVSGLILHSIIGIKY